MIIRIPSTDKKYTIPNNSDLFGNIWYTKNINLKKEGYIELSPRTVSAYSEITNADFDIPVAIGRYFDSNLNKYLIDAADRTFTGTIDNTTLDIEEESGTGAPALDKNSHGRWFNNKWHVSEQTRLSYRDTSSDTWSTAGTLTNTFPHYLEVFRNRNSLCVTDGNVVKQLNTSYSETTNLTLPADFWATGLAYTNNQMGIITRLSTSAAGQNQDAHFFIWSGGTTDADKGIPIGSDAGVAIVSYKGSWMILTRVGELIFYNGAGFDPKGRLPYYYLNLLWGSFLPGENSRRMLGDVMTVDGDQILFNFPPAFQNFGKKDESYVVNNPGGILVWDPSVGFYHKYSPSISPVISVDVTEANVNTSTNILTTGDTLYETGNPVKYLYASSSPIGGLTLSSIYYIIKESSTTFKLATTKANALAGTAIDLTSDGNGDHVFLVMNLLDYGQNNFDNCGGLTSVGQTTRICDDVLFGGDYDAHDHISTQYAHLCITCPGFTNIGYFVTPKITSLNITDRVSRIYIKYAPLTSEDQITVKYRAKEITGLPVTAPQLSTSTKATWTSATVFTTTANISEAKTAVDSGMEIECELISGAGSGQCVKVQEITESSGTYTVTLAESVEGAASGRYSSFVLDHWITLGTVTETDNLGYKQFSIDQPSKWYQFKVELKGSDVVVEEFLVEIKPQVKAEA